MADMRHGFVENQGVKIHYLANERMDKSRPTLVFVCGVMMAAWIWEPQLNYFSNNYNVVAIDPRSQGDSDQCTEGHFAYSRAQDIKAVVDHLACERFVLIGWSIGVPEVVNYTVHFSTKELVGLVLVDGIVGADAAQPFYPSMLEYWSAFQVDRPAKTKEFLSLIFRQPKEDIYMQKLNAAALATPTNTVMTLIYNYILQDSRPLLPRIKVPTWIATIEGPRLDYMRSMQEAISGARLDIFESAGHALFVDQPELFNKLLEAFIKKVTE